MLNHFHGGSGDGLFGQGISCLEGVSAQDIQGQRIPLCEPTDHGQGLLREDRGAAASGDSQTVIDILPGFRIRHGLDPATDDDPLLDLPDHVGAQLFHQLRPARQHKLKQFGFAGFQIGQQANLFDDLQADVVGLVEEDGGIFILLQAPDQVTVEIVEHGPLGVAPLRHRQFQEDVLQKLFVGNAALRDEDRPDFRPQLTHRTPDERGLSDARVTQDKGESFSVVDPV